MTYLGAGEIRGGGTSATVGGGAAAAAKLMEDYLMKEVFK